MVDSQQVRAALRQLRTEAKLTPEEFADEAGVNRATVYRIEDLQEKYSPKIETVSALAESRGLTLTAFFARIEGSDLVRHTPDQQSAAIGGADVPASGADKRDRLSKLESEIAHLKAQWGDVQNVASRLFQVAAAGAEGRATPSRKAGRRRAARKTG